jgi:DNA-binding NarL/FixJ family response regulator
MEHFVNTSEDRVSNNSEFGSESKRPRVFIADDSAPMLETIVRLLSPHFEIVGTAKDGSAALEMIKRIKPDVAVLDMAMPFKTGIEIAADLKTNAPQIRVVIVSAHHDESYVQAVRDAGVLAYIAKIHLADELVPAIENVCAANKSHSAPRSRH